MPDKESFVLPSRDPGGADSSTGDIDAGRICMLVRNAVRSAGAELAAPDGLLLKNGLVRDFIVDPAAREGDLKAAHAEVKCLLLRYCEEQARNAVEMDIDDAAESWLQAKGALESLECAATAEDAAGVAAENAARYGEALSHAGDAARKQKVSLELFKLKGVDWKGRLAASRKKWLRENGLPDEDPVAGKYIAWGAESLEKIPAWCLNDKDVCVGEELLNLLYAVVPAGYDDLFSKLNGVVRDYEEKKASNLRKLADETFSAVEYSEMEPTKVLMEILSKALDDMGDGRVSFRMDNWAPVLAEALKLPRYTLFCFDWASHHEDAPDEPGYFYLLPDGSKQEVHFSSRQSRWWDSMDNVEFYVDSLVRAGGDLAARLEDRALVDEWNDIERKWNSCGSAQSFYHCSGDTLSFAESLYAGVSKMQIAVKNAMSQGLRPDQQPLTREETDAKRYEEQARNRIKVIADMESPDLPVSPSADALLLSIVDFAKTLHRAEPFYGGRVAAIGRDGMAALPSARMLGRGAVLLHLKRFLSRVESISEISSGRMHEIAAVAEMMFSKLESLVEGYCVDEARDLFQKAIAMLPRGEGDFAPLGKKGMLEHVFEKFETAWYDVGYRLEKLEQRIVDGMPDDGEGEPPECRKRRMAARNAWYARNDRDGLPLEPSVVRSLLETAGRLQYDAAVSSLAFSDGTGQDSFTYELDVARFLSLDVHFSYATDGSPDGCQTLRIVSRWVARARQMFMEALNRYCDRRGKRCLEAGEASRLWYEAMSMLNGSVGEGRPVLSAEDRDRFVKLAHNAAKAEWIETRMREKERDEAGASTRKMLCECMLEILKGADSALMWDINRGLYSREPTKIAIPKGRKSEILNAFPHQKGELERIFAHLEERGIKRHEFVIPSSLFMSQALRPFSEEFFGCRKAAGECCLSEEYRQKISEAKVDCICAWQCFIDDLPDYVDDSALVARLQDTFSGLTGMFERRLLLGDEAVDLTEYRSLFSTFKEKLLDVSALVLERTKPASGRKGGDPQKETSSASGAASREEELLARGRKEGVAAAAGLLSGDGKMHVILDGLSKTGRQEVSAALRNPPKGGSIFTGRILMSLFGVTSESTITSWRKGDHSPEGFLQALETNNGPAMWACAEKYRAKHHKGDAMNVSGVLRNLSEEEIYMLRGGRG
ncbi:MAG: hypothetical protein K6F50_08700 [Kiritimatiellae bacterium]|nr:hypothetical protein [Kiritimatiellia bacterium]